MSTNLNPNNNASHPSPRRRSQSKASRGSDKTTRRSSGLTDDEASTSVNRSIEIFFGDLTNFGSFCSSLTHTGYKTASGENEDDINVTPAVLPASRAKKPLISSLCPSPLPPEATLDSSGGPEVEQLFKKEGPIFGFQRPVRLHPRQKEKSSSKSYHFNQPTLNSTCTSDSEDEDEIIITKNANDEKLCTTTTSGETVGLVEDAQGSLMTTNPLGTILDPTAVKKLCLIGHPLTSFKGVDSFKKLREAWITNCNIKDLKWQDFQGLQLLRKLYLFGGEITTIEPLHFENLKVLWLSNNHLTSLNFLSAGLVHLTELNVANNQITCIDAEDLCKCGSLQILNVAANPLCSIQDVESLNLIPTVKELNFIDQSYGKCPVASFCESRTILVSKLRHVVYLDGKEITREERFDIDDYVQKRFLYYFTLSAECGVAYCSMRKAAIQATFKQLEQLSIRMADLSTWSAKCLQIDFQMTGLSIFGEPKQKLLIGATKIHKRLSNLRQWTRTILKRIETLLRISRWEQEMDQWSKWIEFKSFGNIRCYIAHSVLDPEASKDVENIRSTLHQLFSALSCNRSWPRNTILKLETVIVIKDKGAEVGMEKIFEDNYSRKNEPKFIPPPQEDEPIIKPSGNSKQQNQFYGPPVLQPCKVVPTYVDPGYKHPPPVFPYPESVHGLTERSEPMLLFLITRKGKENDPLYYFHNLMFDKSKCYQDVRLTNCIWLASQLNSVDRRTSKEQHRYTVLFVVKVLEECLVPIGKAREGSNKHGNDCAVFGLNRPLCFAPAYIVNVSHVPNDKSTAWFERVTDDFDVTQEIEQLWEDASFRLGEMGVVGKKTTPYFLHKTVDGVKADLTSIVKIMGATRNLDHFTKSKNNTELLNVTKFLGPKISETITSLDLSANKLGVAVGMLGLIRLQKLNLSFNILTTLSGMSKLPQLKELRVGWNCLRFFESNISILTWACPKLEVLEVLPNPFQDVRDYSHIPVFAHDQLPFLKRVDAWIKPFTPPNKLHISDSDDLFYVSNNFCKELLASSLSNGMVGDNVIYLDYQGQCLSKLHVIPELPYSQDSSLCYGILLNLSNNMIISESIRDSPLVRNDAWRSYLVKLELQENSLVNLLWMDHGVMFPVLRFLDLSNNYLSEFPLLPGSCPNLIQLQVGGNPIPCNLMVLQPLKKLKYLVTFSAVRTPLSSHSEYAAWIAKYMKSVQILDGVAVSNWSTEDAVEAIGGTMSYDWLEAHIGQRNWNHLTELSLPNCGITKVEFPSGSLPKLLSLDLSGNNLTSLAGLGALGKLRVLCVSNNRIQSLGEACAHCHEKTLLDYQGGGASSKNATPSRAQLLHQLQKVGLPERHRFPFSSAALRQTEVSSSLSKALFRYHTNSNASAAMGKKIVTDILPPRFAGGRRILDLNRTAFPNLEVLVLSHNGLSSVEDLHLHSLPALRTVLLNCNRIKGFEGLDNLSTIKALVLDNNQISHVPFTSMSGCSSLKYLHLEHNKIAAVPKLPNLKTLSSLHIGYNRIQSLTDIGALAQLELQELTLLGNPSCKADYWKNVLTDLPDLHKLDGVNALQLKACSECDISPKRDSRVSSDEWEDFDDLPPGYSPDGGNLRIKTMYSNYYANNINSTEE